ncbi:kinase-like protein [Exidia glandulosa HHB12029]|uniref:Kinase-like protein n=1 Tax=Exidia glandulosa HHB12029 TaxID=1314781 RepID=A0A165JKG5_EXIGL|nr:kinase-like protein [Exidia glandulosa HHB12029]
MSDVQKQVDRERSALRARYVDIDLTGSVSMDHPFPVRGGGYSDVYSGSWTGTGDTESASVALKVLRMSIMPAQSDAKIKIRLRQEISIWRRLQHPNVQPLLGLWWDKEWTLPAMVSTWEENGNLLDYLGGRSGTMSASELRALQVDLIDDVLNGLSYLHGENVVHADIKGANVLVSSKGTAMLCDFGVSWTSIKSSISFSMRESTRGTNVFLAPELLGIDESPEDDASLPYSFASDVWSFGCLIFEVMTGTAPWHGKSYAQVIIAMSKKVLYSRPASMDVRHWDVVQLCCVFNPTDRPATDAIRPVLKKLRTM